MRKWLIILVVPALLLGACNGGGGPAADEDPTGALVAALEETANSEQQTISFSIQSTPESLVAASAEDATPLSPEMAETILGSSISISVIDSGEEGTSLRVSLAVPGSDGAEAIVLGQDLYARADVRGLATAFGQDTAAIDTFLQSEVVQQYPFIESGVNGEFLKIEGTEELTGGTSVTEEVGNQREQVLNSVTEAIREEANVEFEGEDDVGDHFVVSAPAEALYNHFAELAGQLGASPPTETDIPEGDVTFDAWVADGRIAQLEVDAVRLAEEFEGEIPEGVEELAFRMSFGYEVEEISAPEDAVTVTGEDLMALIFGGAFGGTTDVPEEEEVEPEPTETTGFDCSDYENLPPETFEGLPQETLDQLEELCPGITG